MTVGKYINVFKSHLCTTQTQAPWGICLTQIWECAVDTSLSCYRGLHYTCLGRSFSLASSVQRGNTFSVGMCLAVLWECVWLLVSDLLPVCPEGDLCITGETGKVELICWPLERGVCGGVCLSLARSMLQERLGCSGSVYVAVQGNE